MRQWPIGHSNDVWMVGVSVFFCIVSFLMDRMACFVSSCLNINLTVNHFFSSYKNGARRWANHPVSFCKGVRHLSQFSSVSLKDLCFSRSKSLSSSLVVH